MMTAENKNPEPGQPKAGQKLYQTVKAIFRILLGASLLFAGISHLTVARTEFLAQVPTWLPLNADLVVVLSGIAEIVLGLALIFLVKQRALAGLATDVDAGSTITYSKVSGPAWLAVASNGAQAFFLAVYVVANDAPCRFEYRDSGPVVLLELHYLRLVEIALEFENVADIGAAPGVDGLVVIADDAEVPR
jgi:uncharacterized membrane protein YphA (DoxX/SURF4 family)